jgi:hypothetical protein
VAGVTVLGALTFTYFLGRSHPNNLFHVSPPGVVLLFVWLGVLRGVVAERFLVAVATACVCFFGAFVIAGEGSAIKVKYPTTPLAAVLGDGPSLGSDLQVLWNDPVVDPDAAHVAQFVAAHRPPGAPVTILLTPSVQSEALLRLGAANAVGTTNPCQDSFSTRGTARAASGVAELAPGGILVTTVGPEDDVLLPIQQYTLALLRARFVTHVVATDGGGVELLAMTALRARAAAPVPVPPVTVPGGTSSCG